VCAKPSAPPAPACFTCRPTRPTLRGSASKPIEQAFAKLKALPRQAAARTREALWNTIGQLIGSLTAAKCRNYLANSAYAFK
jgi:hypothetical protein